MCDFTADVTDPACCDLPYEVATAYNPYKSSLIKNEQAFNPIMDQDVIGLLDLGLWANADATLSHEIAYNISFFRQNIILSNHSQECAFSIDNW